MKIGVWLGNDLHKSAGGAFSYTDRLIQMLDEYEFAEGIELCFVSYLGTGSFSKPITALVDFPQFLNTILTSNPVLYCLVKKLVKWYIRRLGMKKQMRRKGIKVIYYIHQGEYLDSTFPFIATNWDIGHRSTHAFPELIWDGKSFEVREKYYRDILPKALMVFCESESGRKELIRYTNIGEHKIRIFPLFGGNVTTIKIKEKEINKILDFYGLKKYSYFFYPAQFWAHKNHYNLIKGFVQILHQYPEIKLVLSGADKGNKDYIESLIKDLHMTENVVFLNFVPTETLYCMYKYATALVMASHFGPTNMPPIEAMEIGCPVICSDLGGHHEILDDAAIYFNSYDITAITNAMFCVIENNDFYRTKILKQKNVSIYSQKMAMPTLECLLKEVINIRSNWD